MEHLLTSVITLDVNIKLNRGNAILSTLALPAPLAVESYQLPMDPAGSRVFGEALKAILQNASFCVRNTCITL